MSVSFMFLSSMTKYNNSINTAWSRHHVPSEGLQTYLYALYHLLIISRLDGKGRCIVCNVSKPPVTAA